MLTTFAIAAFLLLTVAPMSAADAPPSQLARNLAAGRAQHLLVYGTSLTAGGAWPQQIKAAVQRRHPGLLTVTNSGQGGMWSKWGAENLEERVIAKKPDTVLIEFGINDGFAEYATPVEAAQQNLVAMITRIRAALPGCEIGLMTMNQPVREHATRRPDFAAYMAMYRRTAAEQKTLLIDLLPAWEQLRASTEKDWDALVPDGIHPSAAGNAAITTPGILAALFGSAWNDR